MIPSNNLSVLPWYTSIEQQNARKWWVYDRVYPLFVTPRLVPFQLSREHGAQFDYNISTAGTVYNGVMVRRSTPPGEPQRYKWTNSLNYTGCLINVSSYRNHLITITLPQTSQVVGEEYFTELAFLRSELVGNSNVDFSDGTTLVYGYHQTFQLVVPEDAVYLFYYKTRTIEIGEEQITTDYTPTSIAVTFNRMAINRFRIYKKDGTLYRDNYPTPIYAKTIGDRDYFICPAGSFEGEQLLDIGQYYAEITDGDNTWYSEVFTVVEDLEAYLKIEWWDDADFIMDAGAIVYKYNSPTYPLDMQFKNVLYLQSDIAKPEYNFEEEGENRDGYFFPIKQISEKRYRFKFFASEYLLDVMRLIRMADHIKITYRGQEYYPDSFLITPQWEDNGAVASVEGEFNTATVAKKLGSGLLRTE